VAAASEPLVVWINGAFGVGKTAVALELLSPSHLAARVARLIEGEA